MKQYDIQREPYPTIRTEQIILPEPTLEDCDAYHLILSKYEVIQHINLRDAPDVERSCKFVSWMTKLYRRNKGCAWTMEHATTGQVMGAVRIEAISHSSHVGTVGYEMHLSADSDMTNLEFGRIDRRI